MYNIHTICSTQVMENLEAGEMAFDDLNGRLQAQVQCHICVNTSAVSHMCEHKCSVAYVSDYLREGVSVNTCEHTCVNICAVPLKMYPL